jgi:hypothetical protein
MQPTWVKGSSVQIRPARLGDVRLEIGGLCRAGRASLSLGDDKAAYCDLSAALAACESIGDERTAEIAGLLATVEP